MKYTIVWNENKTEGIILSGEDRLKDAAFVKKRHLTVSCIADHFRYQYDDQKCTIQDSLVSMQPTDEMIKAGMESFYDGKGNGLAGRDIVINIWQAMVQEMNK